MHAAHVTYCYQLSLFLSNEDVCKNRMLRRYYLGEDGGLSAANLTDPRWNAAQSC